MKFAPIAFSLFVLSISAAPAVMADNSVSFVNKSGWEIHELYLSPASQSDWGPDQLEDEIIENKSSFELTGIPSGKYDLKLVDEDDDECVVEEVAIGTSGSVTIEEDDLLDCQEETEE